MEMIILNHIYYEIALIINKTLYEKNYITYQNYLLTENNLIKESGKNEFI